MVDTIRLLLDFGLFVLIWMVQLIVYPGFLHYSDKELQRWHARYTPRISFLVIPLMLGQLMLYGALLQQAKTFYSVGAFSLVLLVWLITFTVFVPRHKMITAGDFSDKTLQELVHFNWARTVIWSLLFLWNYTLNF
jgi:DMSO reductase anchor subunit